jgi:exodeoxyribonuclease III
MRVASWNVNGLRSCADKGFSKWLRKSGVDIACLQEVRATPEQLPRTLVKPRGLHAAYAPAKKLGYSGVGLFARTAPDSVEVGLGEPRFDDEGRLITARFGKLTIVNGYFPNGNGKARDLSRIPYKIDFYRALHARLEQAVIANERILVLGDWNTAHQEIDLARPRENRENSGFRPEERAEMDRWFRSGWVDTFRHFTKEPGHYSWWAQRGGAREKNVGWRIDYILASPGAVPFLQSAAIHPTVKGSDHCPVSVELDEGVLV